MAVERKWDSWERYGPWSGVVAVVLWVVGFMVLERGTSVPDVDAAAETLAAYQADENTVLIAGWIFVLGGLFFLSFLGALRTRLLAAEGPAGPLTAVAFAGGVATAVFLIGLPTGDMAAALVSDELEPAAAQALSEVPTVFFIGAELSAIVLLVPTALLILRYGVLPRWLAWFSVLLALVLLIGPIGWLGLIFGLPLWVLIVSVLLGRARARGELLERPVSPDATPS